MVFVAVALDDSIVRLRARIEEVAAMRPPTGFAAAWTTDPVLLRYRPLLVVCGTKSQQWVCYVVQAPEYAGIMHPRSLLAGKSAVSIIGRLARLYRQINTTGASTQ